jgi:hypothetical protein
MREEKGVSIFMAGGITSARFFVRFRSEVEKTREVIVGETALGAGVAEEVRLVEQGAGLVCFHESIAVFFVGSFHFVGYMVGSFWTLRATALKDNLLSSPFMTSWLSCTEGACVSYCYLLALWWQPPSYR